MSGPVLFVTGHAPAYRVGAFARLHELEDIELVLFGGRSKHAGEVFEGEMPLPHRHVRPHQLAALAASGSYRAVVCSTAGRLAPLASWAGARRARAPVILWASLWAHPRSATHALSYLPLRRLYRSADAVVTYGPHVSAYVRARGASNVHVAPQAVDNEFWSAPLPTRAAAEPWPAGTQVKFLFVGRPAREKGLDVVLRAWRTAGLAPPRASLALVGAAAGQTNAHDASRAGANGVVSLAWAPASRLREIYDAADVLVVPSIATRSFREPWGLVANEAMNRGLPVIASDAVGAAAGGLIRGGVNGLVFRASDSDALAGAMLRLASDAELRARLGAAAADAVRAFTYDAWAHGFSAALQSLNLSRTRC